MEKDLPISTGKRELEDLDPAAIIIRSSRRRGVESRAALQNFSSFSSFSRGASAFRGCSAPTLQL